MRQTSAAAETPSAASGAVVLHPAAEAVYLRVLLEKQPSCLLRIAVDGQLLAVNDAALGLLGATGLAQVLNHNFSERFGLADPGWWDEFAGRVMSGGAASGETELRDLTGAERSVLLQGRALPDPPDAIASLLVAVRDIGATRRLEASLQAHEAERVKLQSALEQQQLALMERESAAKQALAALRSSADRGSKERQQQLATALERAEGEVRRLQAALSEAEAQRTLMQQTLDQRLAAAVSDAEAEKRELQRQLLQTVAEHETFAEALREREAKQQRMVAEHVSARMAAERALTDAKAQADQLRKALSTVLDVAAVARQDRQPGQE
jgi:chromosome segregation ATPase